MARGQTDDASATTAIAGVTAAVSSSVAAGTAAAASSFTLTVPMIRARLYWWRGNDTYNAALGTDHTSQRLYAESGDLLTGDTGLTR